MNYFIQGKGKINLDKNDYLASGGEANIYGKYYNIFKIYKDSNKIIPDGKIRELKNIYDNNIIMPEDILLDNSNHKVGLVFRWIKNTFPLCKLFTNDYRKKHNILQKDIIVLIEKMKSLLEFLHLNKILVVDGNEFNYIININNISDVYFIDTDSYQTKNYPATAIMPSIKDYHSNEFSELTDWFSFAIICCQLLIGIHPFKGRYQGYKACDLEKRMIDNISIFYPNVIIPKTTRDFSDIPRNYYDWFIELFEKGRRLPPPDDPGNLMSNIKIIKSSIENKIKIEKIKEIDEEILFYSFINNKEIIKTKSFIYIDNNKYSIDIDEELIIGRRNQIPIMISIRDHKLQCRPLNKNTHIITNEIDNCSDFMVIKNTLYLKQGFNLLESSIEDFNSNIILALKNIWSIMENSSKFFSNVIYQNVLGSGFLVIPLPDESSSSKCVYRKIDEINNYKVISAKYLRNVCYILGFLNGKYDKFILRFNQNHSEYDCKTKKDISYLENNFTVKDNGTTVLINDDNLEIFRNIPFNLEKIIMKNTNLPFPLKLCSDGNTTLFFKDNKIFKISLK